MTPADSWGVVVLAVLIVALLMVVLRHRPADEPPVHPDADAQALPGLIASGFVTPDQVLAPRPTADDHDETTEAAAVRRAERSHLTETIR